MRVEAQRRTAPTAESAPPASRQRSRRAPRASAVASPLGRSRRSRSSSSISAISRCCRILAPQLSAADRGNYLQRADGEGELYVRQRLIQHGTVEIVPRLDFERHGIDDLGVGREAHTVELSRDAQILIRLRRGLARGSFPGLRLLDGEPIPAHLKLDLRSQLIETVPCRAALAAKGFG